MKPVIAKRNTLIGIAFAAVAATNLACAAGEDSEPRSLVVRYSDLNLTQAKDAHKLYHRIKLAARRVCDNEERPRIYKQCQSQAVANAVERVHSSQLSAIHHDDT
jgi:UrcA family protein